MRITPLGCNLGFAKLVAGTYTCYFYRDRKIPEEILALIPDINNPTPADGFTCEMAKF